MKYDKRKDFTGVPPAKAVIDDPLPKSKTLSNVDPDSAAEAVTDMQVIGNPGTWKVLCKAWSDAEGWMKSTKAMAVANDVIVQVSTQQKAPDGSSSVAEALIFVPFMAIQEDAFNGGHRLVPRVRRQ